MHSICLSKLSLSLSFPPAGSVNVRFGKAVEGPGGRWVPCVTEISKGVFYSSLFQVGQGQRQVCVSNRPLRSTDEALSRAIELASNAAA